MKKILFILSLILVVLSLSACNKADESELTDFILAFETEGYAIDIDEKPLFGFIQAKDGVLFYIDNEKVAIYEYASSKDLEKSGFDFDAVNGRFGLESNSAKAQEIFNSVNNE